MTDQDKQLLAELDYGIITTDTFLKNFSVDIRNDTDFVRTEMKNAIRTSDPDEIQMALALIWLSGDISKYVDILNELLINPNHRSHQQNCKDLTRQSAKSNNSSFCKESIRKQL